MLSTVWGGSGTRQSASLGHCQICQSTCPPLPDPRRRAPLQKEPEVARSSLPFGVHIDTLLGRQVSRSSRLLQVRPLLTLIRFVLLHGCGFPFCSSSTIAPCGYRLTASAHDASTLWSPSSTCSSRHRPHQISRVESPSCHIHLHFHQTRSVLSIRKMI
jgi:hypothetical protein